MKVLEPPKMKLSELKIELIARGLDPNGLKQDLVQRLQAALDEEEFGIAPSISLPSLADSTASITAAPASPPTPLSPVKATSEPPKMKVSELKIELIARGLDPNGLKQDLVQRLQAALDEEEFGITPMQVSPVKATPSPLRVPEPTPVVAALPSPSPGAKSPPPAVANETPAPSAVVSKAPAAAADEHAKRLARAKRFNLPVSVADQIVARAKRFGAVEPAAACILAQELEERAKRFGIGNQHVTAVKKVNTPSGVALKPEVVSSEKLKERKRLDRFAIVEPETPGKKISEQGILMVVNALKDQPKAAGGGGGARNKTAEMLAEEEKRLKRVARG